MRVLIRWGRTGAAAWLSHLDIQRAVQRALRRSGIRHAWSQGFNPHAVLSFASALPVGMESRYEVMDIGMGVGEAPDDAVAQEALARLAAALPPGFSALEARAVEDAFPSPMALVWAMDAVALPCGGGFEALAEAAPHFMAQESIMAVSRGKKGERTTDIRPLVLGIEPRENGLFMRLRHGSTGSVKPETVLEALAVLSGTPLPQVRLIREALWASDLVPLMEYRPW